MNDGAHLFSSSFEGVPTHVARAPGRVNLIGEHTDYNDLPVLPIAIQREARLFFRARDDGVVRIENAAVEFDALEFEIHPGLRPRPSGHWGNYCQAPANEMARRFAIWRGFDGVLSSDVPVAAGLSSSSALVNSVGLALAHVNEVVLALPVFAELMAEAERYTGTRGGGMDQAISLSAREGHAAKITFNPLRMKHVAIPDGWCFVVADTGVRAEKSGAAQNLYNMRRTECERAFNAVVDEALERGMIVSTPRGYPELLRAVGHDGAMMAAEAALEGNLFRRFRHVLSEAKRVDEAADRVLNGDIDSLGDLMDASHGSLHSDYHVSSAELDELVGIAREGGASGARLTGAGLGGCIVALADRGSVDAVLEALVSDYYEARGMTERLDDHLFVAVPSGGASVTEL